MATWLDPERLAREFVDAFNRGDADAFVDACDPDVEIVSLRGLLEHFAYQGRDGARQFLRDSAETWSKAELELLEFDVRGTDMVVDGRMRAIGRASGAVTERPLVWAVRIRDGRVARVAPHETCESARRDLGWGD